MHVDMREGNKTISRERHLLPTLDEVIHVLNCANMFGKLYLNQGYHQLLLHPYSSLITTLSNHLIVLFRYIRLSFGIDADKFQNVIASGISDIPIVKHIRDDVIIYGLNVQENGKALHSVLTRSQGLKITFRENYCLFYMAQIGFFGMVFNA